MDRAPFTLPLPGGRILALGPRTLVMGILNVTPDSFSDGGDHLDPEVAVAAGLAMAEAGADLLDVGGESTRPGAAPVDPAEEQARVLPVIEALVRESGVPVSVDTRHGETAQAALRAGASLVNDVSALAAPPPGAAAARAGAPAIRPHMRGTPADMRDRATYRDLMGEVAAELSEAMARARAVGIAEDRMVLDPGIGFAKTAEQSLETIRRLPELAALGRPILVGPSRKSFLASIEDVPPRERLHLTLGAVLACAANGAHIVRVHDVRPVVQALRAFEAAV